MKYAIKHIKGISAFILFFTIGIIVSLLIPQPAKAALTDIKFGQSQIADSQWNVSACLNTTTCQIYSKNPGTVYKIPWTSGQLSWSTGDYVKFELSNDPSYPYLAKQYNSAGQVKATLGTGKIVNMGPDYFFFVGNDNNTGQLFSGSSGMSNTSGVTWTGTLNPTTAQADAYADASYSTVPLAAGQTATVTPSSGGNQVAQPTRPTWPLINRPANQITFGSGRTGGWWFNWWDNNGSMTNGSVGSINWNTYTGDGYRNYLYAWMRWPGADNGVSRTIWFRTGYDDGHQLRINGTVVTNGGCCYWAYGSYTAKPGEIVKLEFFSDNYGGANYIAQVAWDPQGDGTYELLDSNTVAMNDPVGGGGSAFWYSSDITTEQTNLITAARSRLNAVSGNKIYIDEKAGSSNSTITIEQIGSNNLIQGLGGGDAVISGTANTLNIKQGDGVGKNLIELGVYGNTNSVTIWQARNVDTGATNGQAGGHYIGLGINGDNNTVSIKQGNQGSILPGHFSLVYVKGDLNNINVKQSNSNEKRAFISVDGNTNNINLTQKEAGNHYVDLFLSGSGHTANVTQSGSGTHKSTINLQNSGGSSTLNLVQQGTTGQQYSIMQQCANLNGCSVTITQGGP